MGIENTGTTTLPNTPANNKSAGDTISADTFQQMLNVLSDLYVHNHTFYDDYTTVCECQCACDCGRGTL